MAVARGAPGVLRATNLPTISVMAISGIPATASAAPFSTDDLLSMATGSVQAEVQMAAAVKVLHVQQDMGQAIVALLDSNVGTRFNRSA